MTDASVVSRIAHEAYAHAPSIMPSAPWWDHLETNFARRPEGFELGLRDQVQVSATAAIDVGLRTLGASMVGLTAVPMGFHPVGLYGMLRDRELYEPMADAGDPTRFFRPPPADVEVRSRPVRLPSFRPVEGTCEELSFQSPYVPINPRGRKAYLRHRANRTARARYWSHRDGPRPTIAAIHGFFADPYWLNEWFFALRWFYKLGCDVLLVTLPFHGKRQTRFSPFSGHGFFAGGVRRINEAFGQAVMDFRVFLDHLERERGVTELGVTGVSLGGYTTAILAAVEPRLRFAIPNVPVVSLPDLVLEWQPIGAVMRTAFLAQSLSIRDARHMLAVHCPLTYAPVLPKDRLMIIGGVGDRLAPPKHSRLLWDHWGRCRIHWFPGSHILHLDRGAYLRETANFLGDLGFLEGWVRKDGAPGPADVGDEPGPNGRPPASLDEARSRRERGLGGRARR